MKAILFLVGIVVLIAIELVLFQMDYSLRVTDRYVITNHPSVSTWNALVADQRDIVVENVKGFDVLTSSIIAGESDDGYFLATPAGIDLFSSEREWRDHCYQRTQKEPGFLYRPSRADFAWFWKGQTIVVASGLCWVYLFLPRCKKCFRLSSPLKKSITASESAFPAAHTGSK
jgi:hypothetical protein